MASCAGVNAISVAANSVPYQLRIATGGEHTARGRRSRRQRFVAIVPRCASTAGPSLHRRLAEVPMDPRDEPLERELRSGVDAALASLFENHRERLLRMVQFRIDPRLVGRMDPDDVLQETFLEAKKRLQAYRDDDKPFLVWIRLITQQTMIDLYRKHLGAKMRNAGREVMAPKSGTLSGLFVAQITSPSRALLREEVRARIERALEEMDEIDREVLLLRHFEELTNKETAAVLGIQENAASNRYVRALGRLKGLLGSLGEA
jgi:RNA polymerase sigma-70 factor (ECF subfamily)